MLKSSRIKASGTVKTPRMSIQVNSGAETSILPKIEQLHAKLPRTAATEIRALIFFQRRVNKVMTPAEPSGRSKTNHGSKLLVVKVKVSKYCSPANHAKERECSEGDIGGITFHLRGLRFGDALVFQFRIMAEVDEQTQFKSGGVQIVQ